MRILVVTPELPAPVSGGRTRVFNLIKQLALRDQVSVISFIQPSDQAHVSALEAHCSRLVTVPFEADPPLGQWRNRARGWARLLLSPRPQYVRTYPVFTMRGPLRGLLETEAFDVVVFEHLFLVELLDELGGIPAIVVEHNVESDIARRTYLQAREPIHRLRDWLTWRKLQAFEQKWLRRFPVCVAVSESDAALLRKMSPKTQYYVVPNGVDSQAFAPPSEQREPAKLLFFGTLSYGPNVEGLLWFCREVLPRVRRSRPDVTLDIVGPNPCSQVRALAGQAGVQLCGFVADVRAKLWSATVVVVPLLTGGGTRLKVLEALAAGCPVVSTEVGVEGLSLVAGKHFLLAKTSERFAGHIVSLLDSKELCQELAAAGRQVVAERYDWRRIAPQLEHALLRSTARADTAGPGARESPTQGSASREAGHAQR